jgi:WD40 repeat protein
MKNQKKNKPNTPEVYAIKKNGQKNQLERRDFLKGLGVLTGATLVGCSGNIKSENEDQTDDIFSEKKYEPETITAESCSGLIAHSNPVESVCFNPDGKMLASGSSDNTIKLWSLPGGQLIKTLEGHSNTVYSVGISPDGKTLVSGSTDNTIKLWSLPGGQLIKTLEAHNCSVSISPDGKMLASGSADKTIKLWSLPGGQLVKTIEGDTDTGYSVTFSPDGKILASGSLDNTVKLWSLPDGQLVKTLEGHTNRVESISISPDGKILASGSSDNTIKLWSLPGGQLVKTIEGDTDSGHSVSFSPDGKILVSGSFDNTIKFWSLPDGQLVKTLKGHSNTVNSVRISPDGKMLASGSADGTIKLWKWSSFTDIEPDASYEGIVGFLSPYIYVSNDHIIGKNLESNKLRIIDIAQKKATNRILGLHGGISSLILSNDSKFAVVGDDMGRIRWCSIADRKIRGNFKATTSAIRDMLLSNNNSILITCDTDKKVKLRDFPEGKLKSELDGSQFALSEDEKLISVLGTDQSISIKSFPDLKEIKTVKLNTEIHSISFAPGNNLLFIGTNSNCVIYDFQKEKEISTFTSSENGTVSAFSANKEGTILTFTFFDDSKNGFCVIDLNKNIKLKEISFSRVYWQSSNPKCKMIKYLDQDKIVYINDEIRIFSFTDYIDDVILSNCLYDKKILEEETKGIKYQAGSSTMTLPCGSAIPPGAVCTCNCVMVGSPRTYYSSPSYYYVSYWYPN